MFVHITSHLVMRPIVPPPVMSAQYITADLAKLQ